MTYRASLTREWFAGGDLIRLLLYDKEARAYLMPDGTWFAFAEGVAAEGAGILLPAEAVEALAVAVQDFQGHASHADTEARVLREWLVVEQRRVDDQLRRGT